MLKMQYFGSKKLENRTKITRLGSNFDIFRYNNTIHLLKRDFFAIFVNKSLSYMKHIGYIGNAHINGHVDSVLKQMKEHGCKTLYTENGRGRKRPQWDAFIKDLNQGDCAVLLSFDNAFYNFHDMIFFVKFCRKSEIRIISIADGLDTQDELYPGSRTANTLDLVCQVFSKRDRNNHDDLEAELYSNTYSDRKLKRYRMVINMYKAGYGIKDIMARTGYRSKSNLYRILHMYGVQMEYPSMSRAAMSVAKV